MMRFFPPNRSPKASLLFQLWQDTPDDPHTVHQPLPGPHHHLHHLHQRHHHVLRALQSTSRKDAWFACMRRPRLCAVSCFGGAGYRSHWLPVQHTPGKILLYKHTCIISFFYPFIYLFIYLIGENAH